MATELNLVADLAVILIAAGIFTIISRALKQPLILGYIIAGFLISPHLGLLPAISSVESVNQWSEIGIIFLLFALGLEFSFKKLLKVGSSALTLAGTKCIGMFIVGMIAGPAMGWTTMESIFLGGLLSMSSTTIIIKAYDDLGLKKRPYATLIFGSLVVEDLIAVLLMVLLSTLAVSNKFAGGEMVWSLAKLAFFIILWFLVGIYVIPTALKKARKYLNDEILLIIAIGLCFGMVTLASAVGFSSALGAFVMGSILAETIEGEHIEHLVSGIKDLFGAIFFVSVGMMIDPAIIGAHWGTILIITIVAMSGILVFSTAGALLAGKSLNTAVHSGFTLAQLGEFGFILASLGCSLGVMREFIYPVIIAVSALTTFTTPYMIKAADPVSKWLHKKLPAKVLGILNTSDNDNVSGSMAEKSEWKKLLSAYALRIVLYGVILIALGIGSSLYLEDALTKVFKSISPALVKWIKVVLTIAVMSPFIYGMSIKRGSMQPHIQKLLKEKNSNKWPVLSLMVIRLMLGISVILFVISSSFELKWWGVLLVVVAAVLMFLTLPKFIKFYELENKFMANLNERELERRRNAPVTTSVQEKLAGYDVHIEPFVMSPDSGYIGRKLREMPFRKTCEINIIKIQRGSRSILIPAGDEPVYPYDKLLAVGTGEQLAKLMEMMKGDILDAEAVGFGPASAGGSSAASSANSDSGSANSDSDFVVDTIAVGEGAFLDGKVLRDLSMRASGCMVISILREGDLITNPSAEFRFQSGDLVWLAGQADSCRFFE